MALSVAFIVMEEPALALLTLVAFHCLLWPGEAAALTREDVHVFTGQDMRLYPNVRAVIQLGRAKTRRRTPHAARQCVTVGTGGLRGRCEQHSAMSVGNVSCGPKASIGFCPCGSGPCS